MRQYVALAFRSTHDALEAEDLISAAGIDVVPIPIPSRSSGRCGIAMRVAPPDEEATRDVLREGGIEVVESLEIEDF